MAGLATYALSAGSRSVISVSRRIFDIWSGLDGYNTLYGCMRVCLLAIVKGHS